jgi:hypothetical protein
VEEIFASAAFCQQPPLHYFRDARAIIFRSCYFILAWTCALMYLCVWSRIYGFCIGRVIDVAAAAANCCCCVLSLARRLETISHQRRFVLAAGEVPAAGRSTSPLAPFIELMRSALPFRELRRALFAQKLSHYTWTPVELRN